MFSIIIIDVQIIKKKYKRIVLKKLLSIFLVTNNIYINPKTPINDLELSDPGKKIKTILYMYKKRNKNKIILFFRKDRYILYYYYFF